MNLYTFKTLMSKVQSPPPADFVQAGVYTLEEVLEDAEYAAKHADDIFIHGRDGAARRHKVLLDEGDMEDLLCRLPDPVNDIPFEQLSKWDWVFMLPHMPALADKLSEANLTKDQWVGVVVYVPTVLDKCPCTEEFSHRQWSSIVMINHQLARRWPFRRMILEHRFDTIEELRKVVSEDPDVYLMGKYLESFDTLDEALDELDNTVRARLLINGYRQFHRPGVMDHMQSAQLMKLVLLDNCYAHLVDFSRISHYDFSRLVERAPRYADKWDCSTMTLPEAADVLTTCAPSLRKKVLSEVQFDDDGLRYLAGEVPAVKKYIDVPEEEYS